MSPPPAASAPSGASAAPAGRPAIVALPMYDRPETAAAHDALWHLVRDALAAEGIAAPAGLDRAIDLWEGWEHPDLLLGQTCSLPYRQRLAPRVTMVGTLDYALPEAPPGAYYSHFVVRAEDPRDRPEDFALAAEAGAGAAATVLAVSQAHSHSGWGAPWDWARRRGLGWPRRLVTGSHRASAAAVAEGRADIAAIDAITWAGIGRWEAGLAARLRIVGRTAASPGLPLIAGPGRDPAPLCRAVAAAVTALDPASRDRLGLAGLVAADPAAYLALPIPPAA